jgi:hypothetical protein
MTEQCHPDSQFANARGGRVGNAGLATLTSQNEHRASGEVEVEEELPKYVVTSNTRSTHGSHRVRVSSRQKYTGRGTNGIYIGRLMLTSDDYESALFH